MGARWKNPPCIKGTPENPKYQGAKIQKRKEENTMYYEINVSLNGKHLFATAERSTLNLWNAEELYNLFIEKFPEEEGYKIEVTCWEKIGKKVEF